MSINTLPGTPTARDIDRMVEDFGPEAVGCWLLMQMWHVRQKADKLASHLQGQWLYTAAWYAARYQELRERAA